jgi:hypothetical protein
LLLLSKQALDRKSSGQLLTALIKGAAPDKKLMRYKGRRKRLIDLEAKPGAGIIKSWAEFIQT